MLTIEELQEKLQATVVQLFGLLPDGLVLEQPKNSDHGCLSTNAAMLLARPLKRAPKHIAEELMKEMITWDEIEMLEIAGPGFINMRMVAAYWPFYIGVVLSHGDAYGRGKKKDKKVSVEYVSANPTGPLHVANARGAVVGDVIANLMEFNGYDVTKEYYVNDAGEQVKILAASAFLRYQEALGKEITIPEGYYPGAYLIEVGQSLKKQYGEKLLSYSEEEALKIVSAYALQAMVSLIQSDLSALGVQQEYYFESDMSKETTALKTLQNQGLIYEGFLAAPKGTDSTNWTPQKLTLFKSTLFGDDIDRPLTKSDGKTPTYFGNDLYYHAHKIERGFSLLINVLGADHSGYVERLKAIVAALSNKKVSYALPICQLVKLTKSGKAYTMSKRKGSFVRLRDLIDMCGADAIRFFMLMRKQDAPLDFDIDLVVQETSENPVFYVQYAHARCASILRHAESLYKDKSTIAKENLTTIDCQGLTHEAEKAVLRKVASFPEVVRASGEQLEPHKIAFFARELAAAFHSLWNAGSGDHALRFINRDHPDETLARIALVRAVQQTLSNALLIIGIEPLESL